MLAYLLSENGIEKCEIARKMKLRQSTVSQLLLRADELDNENIPEDVQSEVDRLLSGVSKSKKKRKKTEEDDSGVKMQTGMKLLAMNVKVRNLKLRELTKFKKYIF